MPWHTVKKSGDGVAVVADFANYVIMRRAGMNVEVGVTNNRPIGQRGWRASVRAKSSG